MWAWAVETGNTGGEIKKANKPFAAQFNALSMAYKERTTAQTYEEAIRLFEATHSIGLAESVWEML
jgi:hypothetical protein